MHFTILETAGILGISPEAVYAEVADRRLELEPAGVTRQSVLRYAYRRVIPHG